VVVAHLCSEENGPLGGLLMTRWIARPAARNDAVPQAIAEKQAADEVRRLLDDPEQLLGFLPREHSRAVRPLGGSAGGALVMFRPRRWRVFAMLCVLSITSFACLGVILYAVSWWPGWRDSPIFFVCLFVASQVGIQTWTSPERDAVYMSDTEIINSRGRKILLADLDRVRSARRGRISRILGQQHLYSTSGKRIYLWRAVFDGSDLRKLLGLLQLDEGNRS
jgi:hypothetical protein